MPAQTPQEMYKGKTYEGWEQLSPRQKVERLLSTLKSDHEGKVKDNFATPFFNSVAIHSVTTPTPTTALVVFKLKIPAFYSNTLGNLHGAAHSLLYDNCTSMALVAVSKPGFWMLAGVSRVLDVKYVRAVKVGEEVTVECEVVHVGRQQVALRGVVRDARGRVCSTCEHDKTNIDPPVEGNKGKAKI